MTITHIDRSTAGRLREDIEGALHNIANELGVEITTGHGSYTSNNFTVKVIVSTKGENGEVNSPEAEAFKRCAHLYDLDPDDLGAVFLHAGEEYIITGLKTRARTYPICVETLDGRRFKMTARMVAEGLIKERHTA